jgi:hypothetical protein
MVAELVPEPLDAIAVTCVLVGAAAKWKGNSDFRTRAEVEGWREPSACGAAEEMLAAWRAELEKSRGEMWSLVVDATRSRRANMAIAASRDMFGFVGLVAWFHQGERGRHFNHLVELLANVELEVPLRAEKVGVALLGTLDGEAVLDRGNAFMPSGTMCARLEAAVGEGAWLGLQTALYTVSREHVYRCACNTVTGVMCFQANRHGHCNGRPSNKGMGGKGTKR